MSLTFPSFISIRNNYPTQPPQPWLDADVFDHMLKANSRAKDQAEITWAKLQKIAEDRTLSDEGKAEQMAVEADLHAERSGWLGNKVNEVREAVLDKQKINYGFMELPPLSEVKELRRELRFGELRKALQGANQAERDVAYLKALERGDLETVHAILDAPGGSWVSEDIKQRGADEFAKQHTPAAFQKLRSVLYLLDQLEGLADQTRQMLIGLGANLEVVAKNLKVAA